LLPDNFICLRICIKIWNSILASISVQVPIILIYVRKKYPVGENLKRLELYINKGAVVEQ